MEYRIIYSDELYHHGVKGMRWGHRKQPERIGTSKPRKRMSTAKKVAVGAGIAAAVAGVSYTVITKRNNKLAKAAVQRALRQGGHSPNQLNIKRGPMRVQMEYKAGSNGLGRKTFAGKIVGTRRAQLTGHSRYRMTKTGQALVNRNRAANNMDWAVRENARRTRSRQDRDWFFEQQPELRSFYNHNKREYQRLNGVVRRRLDEGHQTLVNTTPINRLRRQRGPRALRIK